MCSVSVVTMVVVSVPTFGVSGGPEAVLELFPELAPLGPPGWCGGPEAVLELFPELAPLRPPSWWSIVVVMVPARGASEDPEAVLVLFPELVPLGSSDRCFGCVWAVSCLSFTSCPMFPLPSLDVGRGGSVGGKVSGGRSVVVFVFVIDVCL